jgi:hypothetical protein
MLWGKVNYTEYNKKKNSCRCLCLVIITERHCETELFINCNGTECYKQKVLWVFSLNFSRMLMIVQEKHFF